MRKKQEFTFTSDGQIRSYYLGKCLQRRECQGKYVYDFGVCNGPISARFIVKKSMANSVSKLRGMGSPLRALSRDFGCEFCGPYLVVQACKGREVEGGECNPTKFVPGWTRKGMQYVKPEREDSEMRDSDDADNMGIAELSEAACGTLLGDGTTTSSFFYFKHVGEAMAAPATG